MKPVDDSALIEPTALAAGRISQRFHRLHPTLARTAHIRSLAQQALLLAIFLFLPVSQVWAQDSLAPDGWHAELKLQPLADDHSRDVINLVPKQSIKMKAFVWYPTTRTWIVAYPDWDMPGASIEKLNTPVANLNRQHEGQQQYGHTQNYILTPVDVGNLQLRQQDIDISATKTGLEVVPLSPVRVQVELPEGVYSIDQFLPAYALEVKQDFFHYTATSPVRQIERSEVSELTLGKGEMLERRITIEAEGTKGSSIPRFLPSGNEQKTQSESRSQDVTGLFGFEGGKRVDSLFYTPDAGGPVELEQVAIEWWHLKDKKLQTVLLPGASFDSVAVEAYEEAIGLTWWEKNSARLFKWLAFAGITLVVLLAVFLVFRVLLVRIWQWMKEAILSVLRGEPLLFAKLCLTLFLGARKQAKVFFVRWQYQRQIGSVPDEIARYFYEPDDVGSSGPRLGRLRVVILLWELRNVGHGKRSIRYQLPEL